MKNRNLAGAGIACLVLAGPALAQTGAFDPPATFQASEFLSSELLSGPNFRVQVAVENDGVVNRYRLETPDGLLVVDGTDRLLVRVREIEALARMREVERTAVFKKGLTNAAKAPIHLAKGLVTQPVDTISNVATGVGKFFGSVGHSLFGGRSEEEEGVLKTALGFDAIKRQFAYEFGVDPYSRYEPLQDRLTDLSWTAFAGGVPIKVAFGAIPGPTGAVLSGSSFANGVSQLVRDKTPAELKKINGRKLASMGLPSALIDQFLEHPQYSPTRKTFIVSSLEQMQGVADRAVFVSRAVTVEDENLAFFLQKQIELMAGYHVLISPAARLVTLREDLVFLQRADGAIVGVFPLDHVTWRAESANSLADIAGQASGIGATGRELWLGGTASSLFRANLEAQGWVINEDVRSLLQLP